MFRISQLKKTTRVTDLNKRTPIKLKQKKGSFTKEFKLAINVRCDGKVYKQGDTIELETVGERRFNILREYRE